MIGAGALACVAASCAVIPGAEPAAAKARARAETSNPDRTGVLSAQAMLAAALPSESDRCVLIDGTAVTPERRLPLALLSQVDELPWTLEVPVEAYARAEVTPRGAARQVVEIVRFGQVSQELMRASITAHAGREVRWGDAAAACADSFACLPVRARWLDARTVELVTGDFPGEDMRGDSPCRALLAEVPRALELSVRKSSWGGSMQRSDAWVMARRAGVERVLVRHYPDAKSAQKALASWQTGSEGVATVAGMPVTAELSVAASTLVQRVRMSWEELSFITEDHARLEALVAAAPAPVMDDENLDLAQLELVVARVDERVRALASLSGDEREHAVASILVLIERALRLHTSDERLSRRAYTLQLFERRDARAALRIASEMSKVSAADSLSWELARRAALARMDRIQLRRELARVHHLNESEATRMANSLAASCARGEDYERAEWAWLTAHSLIERANRAKWQEIPSTKVDLAVTVRALSVLMSAAELEGPLGVHVLGRGQLSASEAHKDAAMWSGRVDLGKSSGLVLAATTSNDEELRALGETLLRSFEPGAFELDVSFSPLSGARSAGGPLLRVSGQITSDGFVIERVSSGLHAFDWGTLTQLVFEPLTRMPGRTFPPDELVVDAGSPERAERLFHAALPIVELRCARDGNTLTCRGALDDSRAASKGLVALARVSFERELRSLRSGVD